MEQVFSVPVKSLVKTEESEEEGEKSPPQYDLAYRKGNGKIESSSDSDSDDDPLVSSSSSALSTTEAPKTAPSHPVSFKDYGAIKHSLEACIPHLFLPKRIPDVAQPDLVDIEHWILQHFYVTCDEVLQFEKLESVCKMLAYWRSTQPKSTHDRNRFAQKFSQELARMQVGDTLPIYVRKQNSTIVISKLAEDDDEEGNNFQIETFRPCLPSEIIMSTVGSLQVTYPETSDFIYNSNMLCSKVFAKQLHELAVEEFQASMCTSSKANKEFLEHREVPDPFLVSDWLVALLVPSSNKRNSENVKITKKIRDEINCRRSAQAVPFRRSGMWTSIKVVLHLKLLHVVGNENDAKIIYKCLILRVLADICKQYGEINGRGIHLDLTGQMLAKLGRRVKKLQTESCDKQSKFAEEIVYLWSSTLKFAHFVVASFHEKMREIWNETCAATASDIIEPVTRTKDEFHDDLLHYIPWLSDFIAKQASSTTISPKSKFSKAEKVKECPKQAVVPVPSQPASPSHGKAGTFEIVERFQTIDKIMEYSENLQCKVQRRVWLYDTEHFIKYQVENAEVPSSTASLQYFSKTVLDLLAAYIKQAVPHYTSRNWPYCENPVGFSQILLVTLKAIQILDQIAVKQHPLLLHYKSGVNLTVFDKLLFPHKEDMTLLDNILDYFRKRDLTAQFPGILENLLTDLSENSFATRYAERCEVMGRVHQKISHDINESIKEKLGHVERIRAECIKLRDDLEKKQSSCESCKAVQNAEKEEDEKAGISVHDADSIKCKECLKLEDCLEIKRRSVPVYERLLPVDVHQQNAVIFELMIPEEIKNLREGLAILKFDLLREQHKKFGKGGTVQLKWVYFKNLQSYRQMDTNADAKKGMAPPSYLTKVNLCSRLLPTSSTHHTRIKNPDLLSPEADGSGNDGGCGPFIVPNGMDCVYYFASRTSGGPKLSKLCTFQVESTKNPLTKEGELEDHHSQQVVDHYLDLQWALEGTTHTQNRIIAEFSSTHHPELIAFGSLRAGHRIQLMNLYRYMANKELQLEKEPVLALILQTLWEMGPRKDFNSGERESHLEFLDNEFTEEFMQLLEKLVENNDTNYANPFILTTTVVITCRVMELNPDFRERCGKLLKKCRTCADSWVEMIHNEQGKKSGIGEDGEETIQEERHLNKVLLEITICSALTYNVSSSLFEFVLQDGGDLINWLETLSRLYELTQEEELFQEILSPFGRLLLEMARDVPLKLNLEKRLFSSSQLKDLFVKSIHMFSCLKWDWATGAGTWKLMEDKPSSNIVLGKYQSNLLTFDLIQGKFLVNGYSQAGIPVSILHNSLFDLYFRGSRKLKIVQDGQQQKNLVFFRTTDKFHGKHYKFEVNVSSEKVRIREIQENDSGSTKLELLDPDKLRGFLADEYVYQYTHWVDINTKKVYFRRVPIHEADYSLPPEFQLKTDEKTKLWLFHDKINDSFVFNRKSTGFKIIASALKRLEQEKHISIVMMSNKKSSAKTEDTDEKKDSDHSQVSIKLPRYHLNFLLVGGNLFCVQYKGFKVAYNQAQRGTLIGLQHGILLDNIGEKFSITKGNVVKRIVLIPHGTLTTQSGKSHHHRTKIDLGHLRQPPFFSYEMDPVLKRLKADKSKCAWLYLAALHGTTSAGVPCLTDPFTELTGTEMAVQILQSACVWSSSPYDNESLRNLKIIRKLAPKREYYGHGLISPLRSPRKGKVEVVVPEPSEDLKVEQMETTVWPMDITSMSAYDGFAIIVDRLVGDSTRLKMLHPIPSADEASILGEMRSFMDKQRSSEKLQLRSYYRHLSAYNKATLLKTHFFGTPVSKINEDYVQPELLLRRRLGLREDEDDDNERSHLNLKMLLRISQARLVGTLEDPVNGSRKKSDLYLFLIGPRDAVEASKDELLYAALPIPDCFTSVPLMDLFETPFKQNWLKFYMMAVHWTSSVEATQAFSVVLSALAYQGVPMQQLLNLHNVNVLAENINFPSLPESVRTCVFSEYSSTVDLCEEKIRRFLLDHAPGSDRGSSSNKVSYQHGRQENIGDHLLDKEEHNIHVEEKIDLVIKRIKELWPCEKISRKKLDEICAETDNFWSVHDLKDMNLMLTQWYRNYQLRQFVETVESFLDKFYDHFPKIPPHRKQFDSMNETPLEMELLTPSDSDNLSFEHIKELVIEGDLDEPGVIFYSGSAFQETNVETMIPTQKEQCIAKIDAYLDRLRASIMGSFSKKVIFISGLAPRTNPLLLLQTMLYGLKTKPGSLNPGLLKLLGALAVLWTELKRFNRILSLMQSKIPAPTELKNELENCGHENWSPFDYPEWLVLELELDIMIRTIQVDVAHQMMVMPDEKSGVMQLNMGEGKTSVIVPMLCIALANDVDSLCRVTVLNSIFKTNLNLLSFALGGCILSRRVYLFPCKRDMRFSVETLENILQCYKECLTMKGVVLTLPEYRLSFRQLAFDKTLKGYPEIGVKFMEIENGLRRFCRDILDESDELLNVKYQLVYTIGLQVAVDGDSMRWTTCQKLLQIVQDVGWVFLGKMGNSAVEFHKEQQSKHPEQFAYIRVLDQVACEELLSLVADELLRELKLTDRQKQVTKKFLIQEKISQENFKFVLGLFKNDAAQLDEIRLLSGYLRRGIMGLALQKRWRVEYGVDPKTNYRRMAVPYRAKDFAAERTEFGHVDLAIILTHLSYYYSGLNDMQLQEVFDVLRTKPEAETVYSAWIGRFSTNEDVVPKFLSTYAGINLQDAYQRSHLFSLLRQHKSVIDFWLSNKVLPQECKQFPGKIVMSAWDICYEKQRLPITGFSGTNDSSILLPLPISQQDLAQLQDTNQKMEKTLLQTDNSGHKGFSMGVTCKQILEEMKQDGLRVLIDAGALMLECDNEQVAQVWLEINRDIEAAVYFSKDNEILVKCRRDRGEDDEKLLLHSSSSKSPRKWGELSPPRHQRHSGSGGRHHLLDTPLEVSPYRDRLEKCGVFLDDQHTRGIDLKFPVGSKACVTIGSRMRRDKLMQACMRMRQLGNGHTVTFYLSHEAKSKVAQMGMGKKNKKKSKKSGGGGEDEKENVPTEGQEITTQSVVDWVTQNSNEYNREGLVYWALAGKNYAQKLAAQEFHDTVDTHALEKIYCLSRQCVDDEVLSLKDMYGTYTEAELLTKLIPQWFENTQRKLLSIDGCYSLSQRISKRYDGIRDAIRQRCQDYIPDRTYLSGGLTAMEEEQEKETEVEMETETEEERQVVRPSKMEHVEPLGLHENVKQAVLHGQKITVKHGICRLSEIFGNTSFSKLVQPEGWAMAEIYATTDFVSVVKPPEVKEVTENGESQVTSSSHFKTDFYLRPLEYFVSIRQVAPKQEKVSRKSTPVPAPPLQVLVLSPFEVQELLPFFREGKAQTQLHMFSARRFRNQDLLMNNFALQVPRPLALQAQNAQVLLNSIPDGSKVTAALLVASGNLYFSSMEEQQAFARFLGMVPRPWSAEQMNAFEKELIKKTGFLLPKYRRQEMDCCQIEQGAFQKDPIPLVRKILMCRHAVVSDMAHVSRLLNHNWYVDLN